jgi:phospholipid/cholesterol/gamma-HCH transport system substrate-binding protein
MMEKRFKFRNINELNGLLVLCVLALVLAGVIFSGHSQRWFSSKYTFDVLLPEEGASGLRTGADIFILGVSAGLVDDIIVGDDGRMRARVKIRRDFARFVRTDSTASIKKVFDVAGDSYLEITRGALAALPAHNPEIACLASEDSFGRMEHMVADLHSALMPVVKKAGLGFDEWTQLGGDLRRNSEQMHELIVQVQSLAADVEQGKGTAGKFIKDTSLADDAQRFLSRANQTMGELQDVATNLNLAVKNVQVSTSRLPEITDAVANEAKDLPGLVLQTQVSMRELERLIEAMQRNWLVRKYVDKTNPPPLRPLPENEEPTTKPLKALRSPKDSK